MCCKDAEQKKKKARGARWEGEKKEERPLPYNVRISGRICCSEVLAKPGDCLNDSEDCCEGNSIRVKRLV